MIYNFEITDKEKSALSYLIVKETNKIKAKDRKKKCRKAEKELHDFLTDLGWKLEHLEN